MDEKYYTDLEKVRIERAEELVAEAKELLTKEAYKSANNRAFYAIDYHFVHRGDGMFTTEDYKMIIKADQIRNASDYDDFYIASKEESRVQVENAGYIVEKVKNFLNKI